VAVSGSGLVGAVIHILTNGVVAANLTTNAFKQLCRLGYFARRRLFPERDGNLVQRDQPPERRHLRHRDHSAGARLPLPAPGV